MNKDLLQQYASLKSQEKSIAEQIHQLGPQIVEMIQAEGADKIDAKDLGTFSLAKRKTWKFSTSVQQAEQELEELKIEEKATGKATATEKPYLLFKPEVEELTNE
jgi:polyribonucleotide nucleotidyltransferase